MKIWTLMENTACREGFACEHGLSLYIETGNHKILFDAGQSAAFADNAEKMGVDLSGVDFAVLSHGHYDHSGGLTRFLEENRRAKVYVSKFAPEPHYHGPERYIGIDPALLASGRLALVDGDLPLAPGITLHGCAKAERPIDSGGLQVLENGELKPEDFRHEQYLLVEENGKRILFSGCSHRGILNIAAQFQPDVLVGGFHFMNVTEEKRLRMAAEQLMRYPTMYYTGHCTGEGQYAFLKGIMGARLERVSAGMVLVL